MQLPFCLKAIDGVRNRGTLGLMGSDSWANIKAWAEDLASLKILGIEIRRNPRRIRMFTLKRILEDLP